MTSSIATDPITSVQCIFVTKNLLYSSLIPTNPILIPTKLRRFGLSEIINHVLNLEKKIPFDFIINDNVLTTSLQTYLKKYEISNENVLTLEFVESLTEPKLEKAMKSNDWIKCIKANNEFIATGSFDHRTRIYNHSGDLLHNIEFESVVQSLCWLKDESGIASSVILNGNQSGIVECWKVKPDEMEKELVFFCQDAQGAIECLDVNFDGTLFASASFDSSIHIYSTDKDDNTLDSTLDQSKRRKTGKIVKKKIASGTLKGHHASVSSLNFSKDQHSNTLFSVGWDHTVREWDVNEESNKNTMNCENVILNISQSPKTGLLATGHTDNLVRLWDPRVKEGLVVKLKLKSHSGWSSCVSWVNAYNLVSGGYDGFLKVWDIRSTSPIYSIKTFDNDSDPKKIFGLDILDQRLYSGGEEGLLRTYFCTF
ncbi:WD repeat-containing protein 12 [Clydaea vesicula]|uniref:WD repeat-containing protein 12 n=1 Tax=Clydaea vesicula TaxID=447962 RepID=A0AAD5TXZ6_9FUNG|nr:WD repeat-containing protein 12 [Clydaea vesicula]